MESPKKLHKRKEKYLEGFLLLCWKKTTLFGLKCQQELRDTRIEGYHLKG
jgi:hypothetical protein